MATFPTTPVASFPVNVQQRPKQRITVFWRWIRTKSYFWTKPKSKNI